MRSGTRESIAVGEISSLVGDGGTPLGSRVNGGSSLLARGVRTLATVDSKIWTLALTPLLLSPLLFHGGGPGFPAPAARTLGSTIMIATYWSTEALPLAVTAMLPLVLLPLLGVQPGKDVARSYFQDTNLLFLGGLMVASAIEKANLHRRIALRVLLAVGTAPRQLYLGFMLACGFLSMWISNTAATAMMIPIARTLIESIEEANTNPVSPPPSLADISGNPQPPPTASSSVSRPASPDQEKAAGAVHMESSPSEARGSGRCGNDEPTPLQLYTKGLLLSIAYASSIGGIATLTGTGPNLVFSGAITKIFPGAPEVSFTKWMAFACPVSLTLMLIVWVWMCFLFASPKRRSLSDGGGQHETLPTVPPEEVGRQYRMLGPLSYQERMVLGHFIVLTFLWTMRNPLIVPVRGVDVPLFCQAWLELNRKHCGAQGWAALFKEGYVTDSTSAIAVTIALFVAPARPPVFEEHASAGPPRAPARPGRLGSESDRVLEQGRGPMPRCLDWETAVNIPWGIILLLGGGFAIADAFDASGLNRWLGCRECTET